MGGKREVSNFNWLASANQNKIIRGQFPVGFPSKPKYFFYINYIYVFFESTNTVDIILQITQQSLVDIA